jgi:queuine/archaeosine tRNA-ribosyltransferase
VPVSTQDIINALDKVGDNILTELRACLDLERRLRDTEKELSRSLERARTSDRELDTLRREFWKYVDETQKAELDAAKGNKRQTDPRDLKFYASLGAFTASLIITFINLLGSI